MTMLLMIPIIYFIFSSIKKKTNLFWENFVIIFVCVPVLFFMHRCLCTEQYEPTRLFGQTAAIFQINSSCHR